MGYINTCVWVNCSDVEGDEDDSPVLIHWSQAMKSHFRKFDSCWFKIQNVTISQLWIKNPPKNLLHN